MENLNIDIKASPNADWELDQKLFRSKFQIKLQPISSTIKRLKKKLSRYISTMEQYLLKNYNFSAQYRARSRASVLSNHK